MAVVCTNVGMIATEIDAKILTAFELCDGAKDIIERLVTDETQTWLDKYEKFNEDDDRG